MRRRRQPPDTRLDWRDPEMPCLCLARNTFTGQLTVREFTPREIQYQSSWYMDNGDGPHFSMDPTYNLRRK